jgi:hypothetical protein
LIMDRISIFDELFEDLTEDASQLARRLADATSSTANQQLPEEVRTARGELAG